MAMALAGALGLEIYVVTLSSPTMTDEALRGLLNTAGTKSILLLEDVDAAFVDRTANNQGGGRLTFSGLLNALDGVSEAAAGGWLALLPARCTAELASQAAALNTPLWLLACASLGNCKAGTH